MGNPFLSNYSSAQSDVDQASQRFSPYYQAGTKALKATGIADFGMMAHPTGLENRIMAGYSMSPYAQYQTQTLENAMGNQAAAAGELGTPNQQVALAQQEQGIVGKDQQQYLHNAMQPYQWGFNNLSHISDQGLNAAGQMARQSDINSMLAQRAADNKSSFYSSLLGTGLQGAEDIGAELL